MRSVNGEALDMEHTALGWRDSSICHYRGACAQTLNEGWGENEEHSSSRVEV